MSIIYLCVLLDVERNISMHLKNNYSLLYAKFGKLIYIKVYLDLEPTCS